jgi:Xaa-Pro dipeptidase
VILDRDRADRHLRELGLDAVVATSPTNVTYVTDYRCWLAPIMRDYMVSPGASSALAHRDFAVLPLGEEPVLVVDALMAANASECWVRDIEPAGAGGFELPKERPAPFAEDLERIAAIVRERRNETAVDALVSAIERRGLGSSRVGLELDGLPPSIAEEIRVRLPAAEILDCSNLFRLIRAVKSPEELARLEHAAEAAERAAQAAIAAMGPGGTSGEAIEVFRCLVAEAGTDVDHFAIAPRGVGLITTPGYRFAPGDVFFCDFGCIYRGYFSDSGTTVAVGEPSPESVARHDAVRASLKAGAAALRPGVLASAVRGAMWDSLSAGGITDSHPHGHGFGLEVRDYPIVVPANGLRIRDDVIDVSSDLPLEERMVVNLEVPVFTLGAGSIHTEQSFVVTASGARLLVPQDRDTIARAAEPVAA